VSLHDKVRARREERGERREEEMREERGERKRCERRERRRRRGVPTDKVTDSEDLFGSLGTEFRVSLHDKVRERRPEVCPIRRGLPTDQGASE
jgi:hypothetical protein